MPSTIKWRGDAAKVAQVSTVTITGFDAATTYKLTINGKVVSVLGTGSTAATATALQVALAASTIPEFLEVTWTVNSSTVTGTAVTAGVPFTVTSSVSGGAGTIGAVSTTAGSGPNDVSLAANYVGGVLPANGDTLVFENTSSSALWNLSSLSAVALAALTIKANYTGLIGLPEVNAMSATPANKYQEYRTTKLTIGATTVTIGDGAGAASGRIKLNTGSGGTNLTVHATATPVDAGNSAVYWMGTGTNNVYVSKGTVDIAMYANDAASVAVLGQGYQTNIPNDTTVRLGAGSTVTTINKTGGITEIYNGCTTLNNYTGVTYLMGGAVTTINVYGLSSSATASSVVIIGTGTITNLNVFQYGVANLNWALNPVTITNTAVYAAAILYDTAGRGTYTNAPTTPGFVSKSISSGFAG